MTLLQAVLKLGPLDNGWSMGAIAVIAFIISFAGLIYFAWESK